MSKSKEPKSPAEILAKAEAKSKRSVLERAFQEQMDAKGIRRAAWVSEHEFARELKSSRYPRGRRWRFDFAFLSVKIAVEVDGGTHSRGRHTRHDGFEKDCQKMNAATELGWQVLRGTGPMVKSHELIDTLDRLLRDALERKKDTPRHRTATRA